MVKGEKGENGIDGVVKREREEKGRDESDGVIAKVKEQ